MPKKNRGFVQSANRDLCQSFPSRKVSTPKPRSNRDVEDTSKYQPYVEMMFLLETEKQRYRRTQVQGLPPTQPPQGSFNNGRRPCGSFSVGSQSAIRYKRWRDPIGTSPREIRRGFFFCFIFTYMQEETVGFWTKRLRGLAGPWADIRGGHY